MRLVVWPVPPARALASALDGVVTAVAEAEPHEARAALAEGRADLALVPTLDVLRDYAGLALVPGVGLVGERGPRRRLVVGSALDAVRTVAFDPRDAQEALLAQLVLREHYGAAPTFTLRAPGTPLRDALAGASAALAALDEDAPEGAVALDLGQEWTDLTLRPMPWALLAAPAGALDAQAARQLRDAVRAAPPTDGLLQDGVGVYQLTLDGYAAEGLSQLAEHLFATGTLGEIPDLPFVDPEAEPADG